MKEEFATKYESLLAFLATRLDEGLRILSYVSGNDFENEDILRAIGQEDANLVVAQANDAKFLPALKLEMGYEEKSAEEKEAFKENVTDVIDYLVNVDLGTIFN